MSNRLRAQIAEHKQELLELLRKDQLAAFIPPPILRRAASSPAPLSFAQERLWFLEQLEPGKAGYNICRASRLTGNLNIAALEASLNKILRRHEVLRSVIRIADGRPVQVAEPPYKLKLSIVDLQAMSDAEREPEIRQRIQQAAEAPFEFAAGKFLRVELLRLRDDEHILILTTHHIVSDAWSLGILTREMWSLYETYAADKSSRLEELPVQYADFAIWQRDWLRGEVLESQLSYWKKRLNDLPILNLPTDRTRPARQSFQGARTPIILPEVLTSAINELSNQSGVTPFMNLLAAFQVLLHRYCGQEDVVVGSPIANRSRSELEPLIGFFVNTLVLRSDLSGNPTFKELVARVREVCLGAYAHQDLPFEKLVQELQPERDQGRNPLFQVMFVLQNATRPFSGIPGLGIEPIEMATTRSPFDLSLFLRERDGKLIGYLEYSTDLFDHSTIERMAGHFQTLLERIGADPNQPIARFPILTESERHQLLVEWNDTVQDYPKDKCIYNLFEEQVERTPDAVAVSFQQKKLTYRELNARANQLAHFLQKLGVGPEKLVGICVDRSLDLVVGLLGILKASGAYVPLDPACPTERLDLMLKDAEVSVLVTQECFTKDGKWKPVLSPSTKLRIDSAEGMEDSDPRSSILDPRMKMVCLDTNCETIARENEQNLRSEVTPENLAYVIYTSGSTGTPKGVAIEHRNTVALLHWAKNVFGAPELAGVLASTSICFDLSVFELLVPLSWGGKVILAENALHLHSLPAKNEVTFINTVPSVMAELLGMGRLPDSVRTVNLAGEPLRPELVKQICECTNVEKVYDLYGPSESTTYSTFALRAPDGPATIGRPIANTRIYILDANLHLVPIGVHGELYIGGAGVVRGYLNRAELTAEKFVADPFSREPESRLYRTADWARYLPNGNIEFLGRVDNQVKLRGYRIELGEIESVLNQHPVVRESVVVVRDRESSGEKDLVSYFVPMHDSTPSVAELRTFLHKKLPEYMIPSAFVMLDALPLMPNGKIDRKALPPPDPIRPELEEVYVEPRTQVEELIAQIWREILKLDTVGLHDNFFELGGHSLLAIQIISRVREVFGKEAPLLSLFEAPTIAGLAAAVDKTIRGRTDDLPPITRAPRDGPLPLSMNQEHLWRLDRMIPGTHFFNMPYVYRLTGDLNVSALENALYEIIRRHESLRTNFAEIDGRPVQVINEVPDFQLPYLDLRGESTEEVSQRAASVMLEEREGPFDLESGPLLRIKLLRLTETDYLFLVTMHHIISDYWSMRIFRSELLALYEAFSQGHPSPLPDPLIQFADFACWERRSLEDGLLNQQLEYWKKRLACPLLELGFHKKRKRKKRLTLQTCRQPIELDETLFRAVGALAREENVTPFMVLLAALNILLYRNTGQQDIRIGTLVANRARTEMEGLIGHLINTVMLRTNLSPEMTFTQVLGRVRHVTLAAYGHQQLPFEFLTQVLEREENIGRASLFQVLLIYNTVSLPPLNLAGLTFAPLDVKSIRVDTEVTISTFDLIFNLRETSTMLTGSVNYKTDTFDAHVVSAIIENFRTVLESMVMNTAQPISRVSLDAGV